MSDSKELTPQRENPHLEDSMVEVITKDMEAQEVEHQISGLMERSWQTEL